MFFFNTEWQIIVIVCKSIFCLTGLTLAQLWFCTCSVSDSFCGRVARAFQALKGLLERGHGFCLCPCSVHTSVWTESSQSGCLIPSVWARHHRLHVPVGLTQTKPTQRATMRLASQLWRHCARAQSPLSRFYTSCNKIPQTRVSRKTCKDDV